MIFHVVVHRWFRNGEGWAYSKDMPVELLARIREVMEPVIRSREQIVDEHDVKEFTVWFRQLRDSQCRDPLAFRPDPPLISIAVVCQPADIEDIKEIRDTLFDLAMVAEASGEREGWTRMSGSSTTGSAMIFHVVVHRWFRNGEGWAYSKDMPVELLARIREVMEPVIRSREQIVDEHDVKEFTVWFRQLRDSQCRDPLAFRPDPPLISIAVVCQPADIEAIKEIRDTLFDLAMVAEASGEREGWTRVLGSSMDSPFSVDSTPANTRRRSFMAVGSGILLLILCMLYWLDATPTIGRLPSEEVQMVNSASILPESGEDTPQGNAEHVVDAPPASNIAGAKEILVVDHSDDITPNPSLEPASNIAGAKEILVVDHSDDIDPNPSLEPASNIAEAKEILVIDHSDDIDPDASLEPAADPVVQTLSPLPVRPARVKMVWESMRGSGDSREWLLQKGVSEQDVERRPWRVYAAFYGYAFEQLHKVGSQAKPPETIKNWLDSDEAPIDFTERNEKALFERFMASIPPTFEKREHHYDDAYKAIFMFFEE